MIIFNCSISAWTEDGVSSPWKQGTAAVSNTTSHLYTHTMVYVYVVGEPGEEVMGEPGEEVMVGG